MRFLLQMKMHLLGAVALSTLVLVQGANAGGPVPLIEPAASGNTGAVVEVRAALLRDGAYTGSRFDAYYGTVQVQANIQGGRLVSVDVLDFPRHSGTSRSINRQALPMLQSAVIQAQSARVDLISGATLTSKAYLRSLKGALRQAGG